MNDGDKCAALSQAEVLLAGSMLSAQSFCEVAVVLLMHLETVNR
jgi:hypothetical protein